MAGENVFFECGASRREALETDAELFGAFGPILPAVVGDDRAVDLGANRQSERDGIGGKAFGFGQVANGCPSDPHGVPPSKRSALLSEGERRTGFVEGVFGKELFEAAFEERVFADGAQFFVIVM